MVTRLPAALKDGGTQAGPVAPHIDDAPIGSIWIGAVGIAAVIVVLGALWLTW